MKKTKKKPRTDSIAFSALNAVKMGLNKFNLLMYPVYNMFCAPPEKKNNGKKLKSICIASLKKKKKMQWLNHLQMNAHSGKLQKGTSNVKVLQARWPHGRVIYSRMHPLFLHCSLFFPKQHLHSVALSTTSM